MRTAHALGLAALMITAVAASALAQAESARATCVARCAQDHRGHAERREGCELQCPPPDGLTPVARCRFQCQQESRLCDLGCASERDDGARRGCLRRCGSSYHISCPQDCERYPERVPPL